MSVTAEQSSAPPALLDEKAREALITEHVGLVHYIVGRVSVRLPDSVERDDLESAGLIGLVKAADRFDPDRGVKFATYASSLIRGEVMEALRAKDWAPRSVRRRYRELEAAIAQLQRQLKRAPTEEEIRRALDLDEEEYEELLSATSYMAVSSLEELMEQEETVQPTELDRPVEPSASDDDPAHIVDEEALKDLIAEAVDQLPERDRVVIGLYYQDELTLREIGEVLDITESRVCQIHTQAVTRLRTAVEDKLAA